LVAISRIRGVDDVDRSDESTGGDVDLSHGTQGETIA
jgi:hypothetical protein